MNIKLMKSKKKAVGRLTNLWYFSMKPLAFVVGKLNDKQYDKLVHKCKNMSDEELTKRFAKYLIKSMVRRNESKAEFIVFDKRGYNSRNLDEEQLILRELRKISYSCKDKRLRNWYYHSEKAKLWSSFYDEGEQFPAYEKKLNTLLKRELDRLGVRNEYIDIRKVGYKTQGDKYDFYGRYLDNIGYEKTLVIHL